MDFALSGAGMSAIPRPGGMRAGFAGALDVGVGAAAAGAAGVEVVVAELGVELTGNPGEPLPSGVDDVVNDGIVGVMDS